MLYSNILQVGTPPKSFSVQFNTGSSDFWLSSSLCSDCNKNVYNPFDSSTFAPDGRPWNITYGDKSASSGVLLYDTVDIGGITMKNISIYAASVTSAFKKQPSVDGLLGLVFDSAATVAGVKTPFQEMVDRKLVSSPVFGVYFGKEVDGGGGELTFGSYDTSHIGGKLTTVPVNNAGGRWFIETGRIGVKNTFGNKTNIALVDTGTTLLSFPKEMALEVAKYYNATDTGDNTFTINENKLEPIEIDIGDTTFTIPSEFLIYQRDGDICIAGFGYLGDIELIILGNVFINNYYTIFNIEVPQIQLAPVK